MVRRVSDFGWGLTCDWHVTDTRLLQTAALLQLCIDPQRCQLFRGRGMGNAVSSALSVNTVERQGRTPLLLYPRQDAMGLPELRESVKSGARYCLIRSETSA